MSTPITIYPNPPILAGYPTASDPPLAAPQVADLDDRYTAQMVREGGFLTAPRKDLAPYDPTPKTGTAASTIGLVITITYSGITEGVYQLGAFLPLYAGSTVNLGTGAYSLVRAGGWPPGVVVNAIGCTPCPAGPLLMDATGARGAWSFDDTMGSILADRTGNGNTLVMSTAGGGASQPDMIPNTHAYYIYQSGSIGLADSAREASFAYNAAAFTVAMRVFFKSETTQPCFLCGSISGDSSGSNTQWELWLTSTGRLQYQYGVNGSSGVNALALPLVARDWTVVSLRRTANRLSATLGINGTFASVVVPANSGGGSAFRVGQQVSGAGKITGGFKDLVIWDGLLTDAQLIANYKRALGLP